MSTEYHYIPQDKEAEFEKCEDVGELLQRKLKYGDDPLEKKKKKKGAEHGDGKVLFHQSDFTTKPERLKNVLG